MKTVKHKLNAGTSMLAHYSTAPHLSLVLLASCLVAAADYAPPASGLVSWWRGNGTAADGADGNHGQLRDGAGFTTGVYGQAFNFNGANAHVWVADAPNLDLTTGLTVSAWVKPGRTGDFQGIVGKWDSFTTPWPWNQRSYTFYLAPNGQPRFTGSASGETSPMWEVSGPSAVPLNEWTHLAATYDGAVSRIYVDGQLAGETPFAGSFFQGTSALSIGGVAGRAPAGAQVTAPFLGGIDEVLLYSRALSLQEIQALAVIPEPTSVALLFGGLFMLVASRVRR